MANKNSTSAASGEDIKVGVSIVQPTEEKLTLLESFKLKIPKLVKGSKVAKKEKVAKTEKTTTKKTTVKATKPKATKKSENKDIEIEI